MATDIKKRRTQPEVKLLDVGRDGGAGPFPWWCAVTWEPLVVAVVTILHGSSLGEAGQRDLPRTKAAGDTEMEAWSGDDGD